MDNYWVVEKANEIYPLVVRHRRYLHENAEAGFHLEKTYSYVFDELLKIGCSPKRCGKMGILATVEGERTIEAFRPVSFSANIDGLENKRATEEIKKIEKTDSSTKRCVLLRADMDALPICEETSLDFKAKNGCMHSCGHDMHTATLLGCAKILCENKDKLSGTVKLMFQPAEEALEGALDMINDGVLDEPRVDFGAMIHVITGTNSDTGTAIIANSGVSAPSADFFKLEVFGSGAHGAMPDKAVDPILIGSHIILALEELVTRESIGTKGTAITIGKISAGEVANVIPEKLTILGSMRTYSEEMRSRLKDRMREISELQARSFRGRAEIEFTSGAPTLKNDESVSKSALTCLKKVWSKLEINTLNSTRPNVIVSDNSGASISMASEDFSYISHKIPTVMIGLCAGKADDGFSYPLHHPKAIFDEKALLFGTVAYTVLGLSL